VHEAWSYSPATQFAYPEGDTGGTVLESIKTTKSFDYNTGWLTSSTDANARTTAYTYDLTNLPTSLTSVATLPTGAQVANIAQYAPDEPTAALTLTVTATTENSFDSRTTIFDGRGSPTTTLSLIGPGTVSRVDTRYDGMGRVTGTSLPYWAAPVSPSWITQTFDELGRVTQVVAPDASPIATYRYNESSHPVDASSLQGQTVRATDAWGRETWTRTDALGHLAEVVTPLICAGCPPSDGTVMGDKTTSKVDYQYNALGSLQSVHQGEGGLVRLFEYDGVQRLVRQLVPEEGATLNADGKHAAEGNQFSDVFAYDSQSHVVSHVDPRGIRTVFNYKRKYDPIYPEGDDPLGRLSSVSYDSAGFWDTSHPVSDSPLLTYTYAADGDRTRPIQIAADGVATAILSYDPNGLIAWATHELAVPGQSGTDQPPAHSWSVGYGYDALGRQTDLTYPQEWGQPGAPARVVHQSLASGGPLRALTVDGTPYIENASVVATGQPAVVTLGNGLAETYAYDQNTSATSAIILSAGSRVILRQDYSRVRSGGATGETGQLTSSTDMLDGRRSQTYNYDVLGRLETATEQGNRFPGLIQGIAQFINGFIPSAFANDLGWTQRYSYDRWGNRQSVASSGPKGVTDGTSGLQFFEFNNRIVSAGFTYDGAGNLSSAPGPAGDEQRYRYDQRGRLIVSAHLLRHQ
jgi:YD repeat-containing protein